MLRDTFGLLLALVTASMAVIPGTGPGPHEAVIGMNEVPTNAKIQDLLRRTDPTRRNQDPRLYDLLFRYLREEDAADLRRCRARVERKRYDHLASDRLWPRRCQNQMWCPKCSHVEWRKRRRYHAEKFRSISPTKHLCCFHLVFTLPDILAPILLKSPKAREEFLWAAWSAMHRCWDRDAPELDARGAYRSQRRFSESFGALFNVHPWGDERKNRHDPRRPEWPVYRPHLDVLMAGYRIEDARELVPLRESWPTPFGKLRAYYREALRAAFTPLLGHLPFEQLAEAHHLLQSEFPVVLWVSPAGGGRQLQREGQAFRRIEYSSRSLWDPSRVIVDFEPGIGDVVIYPTQGGRHRHRVSARKLFPYLYDLKERVVGAQVHRWWGFFGNNRYGKTAQLAGNEPIVEHPRTGGRFIEAYYPNHMGEYDAGQQVIRPRPSGGSRT